MAHAYRARPIRCAGGPIFLPSRLEYPMELLPQALIMQVPSEPLEKFLIEFDLSPL